MSDHLLVFSELLQRIEKLEERFIALGEYL